MLDLPDNLYDYLLKLPKEEIIQIMADAIDLMQAYNGRTMTYCIMSSIEGAEVIEDDDGNVSYRLPK